MLLGEEDASKLTTNSTTFKDVAANRWSAGYIGYCVQQASWRAPATATSTPRAS